MNSIVKMLSLIALVSWLSVPPTAQAEPRQSIYLRMEYLARESLDLEYVCSVDKVDGARVRYRFFLPEPYDAKQTYPLIIWLHGWGDRGDENLSHLMHMDGTVFHDRKTRECPFFVLAPQCSKKPSRGWDTLLSATSQHRERDMLAVTMAILDNLEQEYPIDTQRITVIGISSGGGACWELLSREPDRFAAVAPLGGGAAPSSFFGTTKTTPVWAFHAAADPEVPVDGADKTVAAFQAAGGVAHLTKTKDSRHDCWTKAFGDHDLLNWLLAQRRGDPDSPRPGHYRANVWLALWWSESWPSLIVVGIVSGVLYACYRHVKNGSPARRVHYFPEERGEARFPGPSAEDGAGSQLSGLGFSPTTNTREFSG
jgi:poly(3-hydroxybutyrate) depolymerase